MYNIKDKVILITGAATGIGASVVRALLEESVKHVTILDIDKRNGVVFEEELIAKYGSDKVKFIQCDITQEHELLNAFKITKTKQGYIDVVINNAGLFNDKNYVKEIEVNFIATVRSSLQAWDLMRKDEGGRGGTVINISSIAALCTIAVVPVYSATKTAILKFSTSLGDETHYARTGVRVLTVGYGVTDTTMILKEKVGSFDSRIELSIVEALGNLPLQTPDHAAQGLLEAYKNGKSGSVWLVANGKPVVDITEKCIQGCDLFNENVFG